MKAAARALLSAVPVYLSFKRAFASDSSSIDLYRLAFEVKIEAITDSRD